MIKKKYNNYNIMKIKILKSKIYLKICFKRKSKIKTSAFMTSKIL